MSRVKQDKKHEEVVLSPSKKRIAKQLEPNDRYNKNSANTLVTVLYVFEKLIQEGSIKINLPNEKTSHHGEATLRLSFISKL